MRGVGKGADHWWGSAKRQLVCCCRRHPSKGTGMNQEDKFATLITAIIAVMVVLMVLKTIYNA